MATILIWSLSAYHMLQPVPWFSKALKLLSQLTSESDRTRWSPVASFAHSASPKPTHVALFFCGAEVWCEKCEWKGLKFQSSLAMPNICVLYWWSLDVMRCISDLLPSLKLTWHLKMDGWNSRFLLGWPIFRCELLVSGSVCVIMDK